jgi:hypothetical protein
VNVITQDADLNYASTMPIGLRKQEPPQEISYRLIDQW